MDQIENKIKLTLKKIRPYIQMHKGNVELLKIKGNVVILKISGACISCDFFDLTYNKMVRELLKEEVPEVKKIIFKK